MLQIQRFLFTVRGVNKKLFVIHSNSYEIMAPTTRNQTKTNVVTYKTDSPNKVIKKVSSKPTRPLDVNKHQKSTSTGKDGLPMMPFPSADDLENWLRTNHTNNTVTGLWVKIAKKSSGIPTVTYEEMLDVALCYGWIDGQRCSLDDTWFLQRITPRRPKSNWSQINREKVKRLIRLGRMQPAGQSLIDEAKADGRWDNASKPASGCVVPDELTVALEESSAETIEMFRRLSKEEKLILINRIDRTTTEDERNECIRSIVERLQSGDVESL